MQKSVKSLNRIKLTAVALAVAIGLTGYYAGTSNEFRAAAFSNNPPSAHTGAPGENNCIQCHSDFPLNSGNGGVVVSGLPANYTPGVTYPVKVTVSQEGGVRYGFQTVALDNQNLQAGSYTLSGSTAAQMRIESAAVGTPPNTRSYVEHTSSGINPNPGEFGFKSWTFNWQAPATRKGKVTFYAAGNGANGAGSSGDYIYTGSTSVCSGSVQGNFDGDNKADLAVFRPSTGYWYSLDSADNQFNQTQFGAAGDKLVPGDFDGDGKNETAVFRPSNGIWFISRSSDAVLVVKQFGANGDIPVVGDYTGDGKADLAVFRPSNGFWYTFNLVDNGFTATQFGASGDKPVSGDFDGDGKYDRAVFRPSVNGYWYVLQSSNGVQNAVQFGTTNDRAVPGDYDADGKTDYAVFRPSNGFWYLLRSTAGFSATQFGMNGDQPVATDYDGDCKTDLGVFRPSNGTWYLSRSTAGFSATQFGADNDIAVPSAYAAQ